MAESYILQTTNPLEEKCLDLANHLIYICKVPLPLVYSMKDINASLIILLFENLTNYEVPDFLCSEDSAVEAHNVQAVIDTLSLDILGVSLSHITGEDVITGNLAAVYNLLEVLEGLLLLVPSKDELVTDFVEAPSYERSNSPKSTDSRKTYKVPTDDNLKPSYSKPMKMKRYTKHKNKVTSSDVVPHSCLRHESKGLSLPRKVFLNSYKESQVTSVPIDKQDAKEVFTKNEVLLSHFEPAPSATNRLQELKEDVAETKIFSPNKLSLRKRRKTLNLTDAKKSKDSDAQSVEDNKNLATKIKVLLESANSPQQRALQMKKSHLKELRRPLQKAPFTPCRKSFLLPYNLRKRRNSSRRKLSSKMTTKNTKENSDPENSSPNRNEYHQLNSKIRSLSETLPKRLYSSCEKSASCLVQKDGSAQETSNIAFIKNWMAEFPGLKLPSDVINRTTKQYEQHLMKMHKQLKNCYLKKTKAYKQAEDASKKQVMKSKLLEKDVDLCNHLNEIKQLKANENRLRFHFRDARIESAKIKQYYDEFHLEMRKKMQKRNYSEELVAENVFKEVLKIQTEQVQRLYEDVKQSDEIDAKRHKNYLEALENLYQNNVSILAETIANEKKIYKDQNEAQKQMMRKIRNDLNKNLQKEVHTMQRDIVEAMQDTHFRELDADQYKHQMKTKFS